MHKTALQWAVFPTHLKPNGGESWTQRALVEDSYDDFHLNDLFTDKTGNVYIPAEFGTVYKSRDRGQNWQAIETGYDGSFWGGLGLANGDVLVFGMRGNVWRSSDAGASWKQVNTGTDQSVSGGTQLDDERIVLARPLRHGAGLHDGGKETSPTDASRPFELRHRHRQNRR